MEVPNKSHTFISNLLAIPMCNQNLYQMRSIFLMRSSSAKRSVAGHERAIGADYYNSNDKKTTQIDDNHKL